MSYAKKTVHQALVNLEARPAPAGQMTVVLGNGWPGVLLHEAIGHGLEGDFNRKGTSAFAGKVGQRVAAAGVTVVDDGTIADRRGSLNIDDEGNPTSRTVTLIEDGILKGYMQDALNARLMGVAPTGNGRRESRQHSDARMTNTFMMGGDLEAEEIIASVKDGIYAVNLAAVRSILPAGNLCFLQARRGKSKTVNCSIR